MTGETGALRVLIADDESATRMMVRALFERRGHVVAEAADGEQARRAAERAEIPFDAVLLDLNMPEHDGLHALTGVRALADPARAGAAIIMLTGTDDKGVERTLLDHGADAVLVKPLRWDALEPVLTDCLRQAAGSPPTVERPECDTGASAKYEVKVELGRQDVPEGLARVLDILYAHAPKVRGAAAADGPSPIERLLLDLPLDKAQRLVRIAHDNIAAQRTELRAAAARGDGAETERLAHKIAGVAGTYGCDALRALAADLERRAATLDKAELAQAAAEMDDVFSAGLNLLDMIAG